MNDLISRSEAIRWVKTECNPYGQPTLDYESGIKVIEHLKRMSPACNKWIKCSDRLPDKEGDYLVALIMRDGSYESDIDTFVNGKRKKWDSYAKRDVIAWMSLPEYKENR